MARMIRAYQLNCSAAVQAIDMPRRARVMHVAIGEGGPQLFAEVLEDADTKAFDVRHVRRFVVVMAGYAVPEGAGYVGSCVTSVRNRHQAADYHVYEIRAPLARASPSAF